MFYSRATSIHTGESSVRGLPPKAIVRFPFQKDDVAGLFEQQSWLAERAAELQSDAAPARRSELSAFGGYERDQARRQVDRPPSNVDETEQAGLQTFEDVTAEYRIDTHHQTEFTSLIVDDT